MPASDEEERALRTGRCPFPCRAECGSPGRPFLNVGTAHECTGARAESDYDLGWVVQRIGEHIGDAYVRPMLAERIVCLPLVTLARIPPGLLAEALSVPGKPHAQRSRF